MTLSFGGRQNASMDAAEEFHLRDYLPYLLGTVLIVISLMVRAWWYPFTTSDYTYFVKPWFDTLATQPLLSAFAKPFSDYSPLYLYLLKLITFFPRSLDTLLLVKTLSFAFDAIIAAFAVLIARDTSPMRFGRSDLFLIFAIFISIPTLVLNSSLWGQSDAIYAAPIVACIYWIAMDRPVLASIAFGLALSVKLQALFFLPILAGYLLRRRATSLYLLVPPLIYFVSVLPTAFVGGEFSYWLSVYLKQSGEYPYLSVSAPSIFAFVTNVSIPQMLQTLLFWLGIALALSWSATIVWLVQKTRSLNAPLLMFLGLSCVLVVPFLLPRMHERYFYLADIFSCLYVLYVPRRWYLPAIIVAASALAYMPYLSSQIPMLAPIHIDIRLPAAMLLVAVLLVATDVFRWRRRDRSRVRSPAPQSVHPMRSAQTNRTTFAASSS